MSKTAQTADRFASKVRAFGPRFMTELGLKAFHIEGMFGNFGTETGGFVHRDETKPVVRGSKGGTGWAQWTGYGKGGRRGAFERWVKAEGHDLSTEAGYDEACYRYVVLELRTSEAAALAALKRTRSREAATRSFCEKYERPGTPHLESRLRWAEKAHRALAGDIDGAPAQKPAGELRTPAPAPSAPAGTATPAPVSFWTRLWARLAGRPALPPATPPAAEETKGDPVVWRVQRALQERGYTEVGRLDGRLGDNTRDGVRNARVRAGLPAEGGIDDAFLAVLPKLPAKPIAAERATATEKTLAAEGQPAVASFNVINWIGRGLFGLGAGGALDATGALDSLKSAGDRASGALEAAQTIIATIAGGLQLVVTHWWLFAIGGGLFIAYKVASGILDLVVKFRQGFLTKPGA